MATRARLKDVRGMDWYRIGAEKRVVEGGLDQMSVEEGVVIVNSGGGGPPLPGTGAVELTNLNCDMMVVVVVVMLLRVRLVMVGDLRGGGPCGEYGRLRERGRLDRPRQKWRWMRML